MVFYLFLFGDGGCYFQKEKVIFTKMVLKVKKEALTPPKAEVREQC